MFRGDFIMSGVNLTLNRQSTYPGSVSDDKNHYEFYGIGLPVSRNAGGGGATGNGSVSISKRGHGIIPALLAKVAKGLFTTSARTSRDPIMTLVKQAALGEDKDKKLVAIVGSAMDDSDELMVPKAVTEAAEEISKLALNMRGLLPIPTSKY